jgi:hypothetical protein
MNTQRGDLIRAKIIAPADYGGRWYDIRLHNGKSAILTNRLDSKIEGDVVVRIDDPHPRIKTDLSDVITSHLVSTQVPEDFTHVRQNDAVLWGKNKLYETDICADFRMCEVKAKFDIGGSMPKVLYYLPWSKKVIAYVLTWPARNAKGAHRFNNCAQLIMKSTRGIRRPRGIGSAFRTFEWRAKSQPKIMVINDMLDMTRIKAAIESVKTIAQEAMPTFVEMELRPFDYNPLS